MLPSTRHAWIGGRWLLLMLFLVAGWTAETVDIRRHGAVGDGVTLDTAAIQRAIDAVAAAGGGTVVVPAGKYLTGTVSLRSRVHLRFEQGAVLLGSGTLTDYRKLNAYALIMAERQEDIGISGPGVIDGRGGILGAIATGQVTGGSRPDAREGERPVLINFRYCTRVTVRGVTLKDSAMWVQWYRECTDVLIEDVTVRSLVAITSDGIDLDSCTRVVVRRCDIDSEDDGICLKSGSKPCSQILIEDCRVRSSCNALKFGTASNSGFKDITVRNLTIYDTYISGIALECVDGGTLENVSISNVRMTTTNNPLFIRLGQRNQGKPPGVVRNVTISDVTAEIPNRRREEMDKFPNSWRHRCVTLVTGSITGLPGHPVRGVTLRKVAFTYGGIGQTAKPNHLRLDRLQDIPECAENYPEATMFGVLPAWGLYCRHVEDLVLDQVTLGVTGSDYRAAVVCDDVRNLTVDGLRIGKAGKAPVIVLQDVDGAVIRTSPAPAGAVEFISQRGTTRNVTRP